MSTCLQLLVKVGVGCACSASVHGVLSVGGRPTALQARGVAAKWHSQSSYVNEPIIRKPGLGSEESQRPSQHLLPVKSSFPPVCSLIVRSGRTRGSSFLVQVCGDMLFLCAAHFPWNMVHGSAPVLSIRTKPHMRRPVTTRAKRSTIARGRARVLVACVRLAQRTGHGDICAPAASAFAGSSSANKSSATWPLESPQ